MSENLKILVFVKQVPNTVDVEIDPATGNLKREGLVSAINTYDRNAIEAALQIKEQVGAEVTAISMGPPQVNQTLKFALSMGCDNAILLSSRAFGGADTLATSYTLAKAAEKIGDYDLLFLGQNATDADTAQVGPMLASLLDLPQITFATSLEYEDGYVTCTREDGPNLQKVRAKLPALITCSDKLNTPRYAKPKGIMKANKAEIPVWNENDLDADPERIGLNGSPTIVKNIFAPEREKLDTKYFEGDAEEMAKQLADLLEELHII